MFVRAFIFVVPVIGAVEGVFCIVPFGMQFAFLPLVMVGVCVVVVAVPVGFVVVTGVPGVVVVVVPGGFVVFVVVVPLFVLVVVDVPLVVVVVFGVLLVDVFVDAEVPGGQLVVGGVVVVVGVVVGGFVVVVVGVVCANAGTPKLTTSPATDARPSIARELMRLRSPDNRERKSLVLHTHPSCEL